MPGAVRVIWEPIPSAAGSLQEVTQAKVELANRRSAPRAPLATRLSYTNASFAPGL